MTRWGTRFVASTIACVVVVAAVVHLAQSAGAAEEKFLSGDYKLRISVASLGDKGNITRPAKVTVTGKKVSIQSKTVSSSPVRMDGAIGQDGKLRFGVTSVERNRIVSMHYIGNLTGAKATGTAHFFANGAPALQGTWELVLAQ
ncbi:MAG: hypothetical protein AAF581_17670 [Planctomycetota bacterium]